MRTILTEAYRIWVTVSEVPQINKGEHMINDQEVKEWVEKCPEHDNEILHSDDNGIVICIRFNNEKEDPDEA